MSVSGTCTLLSQRASEIKPSKVDLPYLKISMICTDYDGAVISGIRIIQAHVRLVDYCREHAIDLPDRNFTLVRIQRAAAPGTGRTRNYYHASPGPLPILLT
jgi:hypothetical protein